MEEYVDEYAKFRHRNGGLYAYLEVSIDMLDLEVPLDARNAKKNVVLDEEGNEVSAEAKTIWEYLTLEPIISADGEMAICLLNEALSPRMTAVTAADLDFWKANLEPLGLGVERWMDREEKDALLATERYANE